MADLYRQPTYVGIILEKENRIFLIQRKNTNWAEGYWNFPGGLVEKDESPRAAATREIFEEAGIKVDPENLTFVQLLSVHKNSSNTQDIIGIYFKVNSWIGTPCNNEQDKISAAQWFDLKSLPENITEHALSAINGIKHGVCYAQNGWSKK